MPLIPPRFPSNNATSAPPWARGHVNNSPQNNEVPPWRRNLKSVQAPNVINNINAAPNSTPPPNTDQQPKTSKLQINLKSVKKPDSGTVLQNSTPLPKAIPIPIQIQRSEQNENSKSVVSTIPLQRPNLAKDAPVNEAKVTSEVAPKEETTKMPPPPPPPPGGPPAPPPPPPLEGAAAKQAKVELLRKAPKKRPDWAGMMKEIEKGRVLKHVDCNDRSRPIIPKLKSRGRFVFESEAKPATKSDALHNRLINEIQQGVKLKRVHCNDRSNPILKGLRMRRQSSVAEGEGTLLPMEPVDELAFIDIDVLRDELQSAKQMLQTEIESKHNMEKKTRDQKCQIIAMEAEIESLKAKLGIIPEDEVSPLARNLEKSDSKTFKHLRKSGSSLWKSPSAAGLKKSKSGLTKQSPSDTNVNKLDSNVEEEFNEVNEYEEEIVSLKDAVQHAKKQAEEMESKYKEAMEKLQAIQNNFEDSEHKRKTLEKQLEAVEAVEGKRPPVVQTAERTTQTEEQILEKMANYARQQSTATDADYDSEEEESESEIDVDEETIQKKKHERELILWENKLKSVKDKQNTSRTERKNLKNLQKKLEDELKEANKRHKKLQKEVDKMAKMMMKEVEKDEDDEDDEEEEEEEEEDAEEETEEEEESEEEESESDSDNEDAESSEEDDEDASYEDRLALFGKRVKRRENVLNAMRKGNYLLRANIDRLKDDLEDARIAYHDLEHELNSVLDET